jgi:hypothetical protein
MSAFTRDQNLQICTGILLRWHKKNEKRELKNFCVFFNSDDNDNRWL